ncbi:MAG: response regulator, partial [Myxococcaceae bacterium]
MSPELESQPASEEDAAEETTVGGRRRVEPVRRSVLVVEDDPAQRAMLVELISLWGYRTVAVGSAEEAEALLE